MAYRAFKEHGSRSLFLTYNQALIADVRRTMYIFQIPGSLSRGGIQVDSVMSFILKVMNHFELIDDDMDFLEDYKEIGQSFLTYMESGTITETDILSMLTKHGDKFGFDYIFIDEGQDWTSEEVRMIKAVYSHQNLIIADGIDQIIRGEVADWRSGVPQNDIQIHNLRRSLRMGAVRRMLTRLSLA